MTRIVFISGMDAAPWGGSEVLWSAAARKLLEKGVDVMASVAAWPEVPAPLGEIRRLGGTLDRRPAATLWHRATSRLWRAMLRRPGWTRAWQNVLAFRPDLVCVSHGATTCGIDWMRLCLAEGVPYAAVCQANYEFFWPDDQRAEVYRQAFLGARQAYFVSAGNLRLFETQIGASLPRAEIVWNPFNVDWDARPPWPDDGPLHKVACVARLEPRAKGQDLLIEVLSSEKWRRRPIQATLFGAGPAGECLRRLVDSRGLRETVHLAGHVSDVEGIWRQHQCLILPSRFEGLPLGLVEAMLCGRPGIVTDVAGNADVVRDNVDGFIAAAPTVSLLDEAMERAWQRRDEWRQCGAAAAESIRKKIPRDPAALFADKLHSLSQATGKGGAA